MLRCSMHRGGGTMKGREKKLSLWSMFVKLVPDVAAISPVMFTVNYSIFAMDGFVDAGSVIAMQMVFDKVVGLTTNEATIKGTIGALCILLFLKIAKQLTLGFANFIGETYCTRVTGVFSHKVNLKMGRLNAAFFEESEKLDCINKAYEGLRYGRDLVNTMMDIMTSYTPYFLLLGIYLFSLKPILIIVIVLVFLPVFLNQIIRVKVFSKLEDESVSLRRKVNYYEQCLGGKEYLKETRILGATPYFMRLLRETLETMNNLKWKATCKVNLLEFAMKVISIMGYIGILLLLFDALMKGEISVGAFAAIFASVDNMYSLMEEIICSRLPYCAENFGKIENYLKFLDLPEREWCEEKISYGNIKLEGVSFSYGSSNKKAVEDINLIIEKGETIAVVGENGSGKSTLVRLITGIYLPSGGRVLYGKSSTKELSPKVLFEKITGVFQKFQRYQLSLAHNIAISDIDNETKKLSHMKEASKKAGLEMKRETFPEEYYTMLSREFDGVDLSGGQWQKIALARGFYREHEVIVLDEPTAAIDPIEETRVYERFAEIAKDKTAIIVTHRLGSAKFADRIVVMEKGRIIDIGKHEELINRCNLYEKMWNSQAKFYC